LEAAKQNLENDFHTVCFLGQSIKSRAAKIASDMKVTVDLSMRDSGPKKENITESRQKVNLSTITLNKIRSRNTLDTEFYSWALKRF
jgi:hypothetical protein